MTHPSHHSPPARRRSPWILVAIVFAAIALWFAVTLFANRTTQSGGGEVEPIAPATAPAAAPGGAPAGPKEPIGPARP